MISRRAFLSALAALPFVGKLIPKEERAVSIEVGPSYFSQAATQADDELFSKILSELIKSTPPELVADNYTKTMANIVDEAAFRATFAEWDRKYQA